MPNLIIAATAELSGLTTLHYDKDFDLISGITGQPDRREPGRDGFVQLQSTCARRFLDFGQKYGWHRHTVQDAPAESNVKRGLDMPVYNRTGSST